MTYKPYSPPLTDFPFELPKAVIFDMDGTVVQHNDQRMINIAEWLDDRIFAVSSALSWVFRRHAPDIAAELEDLSQKRPPRLWGHRALHGLRRTDVDKLVTPSHGVIEFLKTLRDMNIPAGLASNGLGKGYGKDVLEAFDLTDHFAQKVFREDIKKSKPNPESIRRVLDKLNLTLGSQDIVWYIGDRRKDVKAAMKANEVLDCHVVPIAYTDDAAQQIPREHLSTNHVIKDFDLIHALLKEIANPASVSKRPNGSSFFSGTPYFD